MQIFVLFLHLLRFSKIEYMIFSIISFSRSAGCWLVVITGSTIGPFAHFSCRTMCVPRTSWRNFVDTYYPRDIRQRDASQPDASCVKLGHTIDHRVSLLPTKCPSKCPMNSERCDSPRFSPIDATKKRTHEIEPSPDDLFRLDPEKADPSKFYRVEPTAFNFCKIAP